MLGGECDWGRVLRYEPPTRVVLSWDITLQWKPERDPDYERDKQMDREKEAGNSANLSPDILDLDAEPKKYTHYISKTEGGAIYYVCSAQPKTELKSPGVPKRCPFCREINPIKMGVEEGVEVTAGSKKAEIDMGQFETVQEKQDRARSREPARTGRRGAARNRQRRARSRAAEIYPCGGR